MHDVLFENTPKTVKNLLATIYIGGEESLTLNFIYVIHIKLMELYIISYK